jgi:hypothetical protein
MAGGNGESLDHTGPAGAEPPTKIVPSVPPIEASPRLVPVASSKW